ncbi:MAG: hypothetical protein IPK82_26810 [Polyangiaceae bacterium]|nr:hypothetical protein [Polyangiaceae bacterium]
MKYTMFFSCFAAALVVGCSNPPPAEHAEHHGNEPVPGHDEHKELKGPVSDFHGILAPIWHSPEGQERLTKACGATAGMREKSTAAETAAPPEKAKPEDYTAAAKGLTAAVGALEEECKKTPQGDVAGKFTALHDAFHKLAELMGPHDEHHKH